MRDNPPQRDIFALEHLGEKAGDGTGHGFHLGRIMTAQAIKVEDFRKALLKWYDEHRRVLPWRALPGRAADPYHVWLSEVMLQQTTVPAVIPYFLKFLDKWPTVADLAAADSAAVMQAWAGLGYYARARNLHKCAQHVAGPLGGVFPDTQDDLQKLPGIGDYTSAAIAAIAFNEPANVVDGNVERVMARIYAVTDPVPAAKPALKSLAAKMAEGETQRPGDYAQALMDLGATICTPSSPKCGVCPVSEFCKARALDIQASLPARAPKAAKPQRHGYIYWLTDAKGRILFERRKEKGLLGGMMGLPTSEWVEKDIEKSHLPFILDAMDSKVRVRHSFTHFDLELHGVQARLKGPAPEQDYFWATPAEAKTLGLPTVFKKAFRQFI
jgi:A/G-specific adenine glycosylase